MSDAAKLELVCMTERIRLLEEMALRFKGERDNATALLVRCVRKMPDSDLRKQAKNWLADHADLSPLRQSQEAMELFQ